jgi:hypothetical protein
MVTCDLLPQEGRSVVNFVGRTQFNLGDDQPLIVAIELVYLEGVTVSCGHKVATLVDDARLAEVEELSGLLGRYLLLELIATESTVERRSLDGKEALLVTQSDTHGMPVTAADIALLDMVAPLGKTLVAVIAHQKLPLNL